MKDIFETKKKVLEKQMRNLNKNIPDPANIVLNSSAFQNSISKKSNLVSNFHGCREAISEAKKLIYLSKQVSERSKSKKNTIPENTDVWLIRKDLPKLKPKPKNSKLGSLIDYTSNYLKKGNDEKEVYLRGKNFYQNLSLAEKIGLEKIKEIPMTNSDWDKLEDKVIKKLDHKSDCPICLEKLMFKETTILSCSHVFHKPCLASYESMIKGKSCPICRKKNYEEKSFIKDKQAFIDFAIILIQKVYRGVLSRKHIYNRIFRESMPKSKGLRKIYSVFKMKELLNKLQSTIKASSFITDELLQDMSSQLEQQKRLNAKIEQQFGNNSLKRSTSDEISKEKWKAIQEKAMKMRQRTDDCSICLSSFGSKKLNLLSCGHIFHETCIKNLEKFDYYYQKRCPVCRTCNYKRNEIIL